MRGYLINKKFDNSKIVYEVQASIWPAYHVANKDVEIPVWVDIEKGDGDFWIFGENQQKESTDTKQ